MSNQSHTLPSMGTEKKKLKVFIPIVVIAITAALLFLMNALKPVEQEKDDAVIVPTVEVISIQPIDYVIPINTEGMVKPQTSISLASEITGKIISVSNNFSNGGKFNKGDVLVEVDPKDYQLAITRAKANVASAKASLDLEQAKSDLAQADWKKYGKKGKPSALNLNLPQVASAQAALDGAVADLKLAQRNLDKTKIMAPFDGVIFSKSVDIGQFVNIGMSLATIASTEIAEIRVSLSDEQLIQSGLNQSFDNLQVTVRSEEIEGVEWQGKVKQIEAQRDSRTLMNYVVIEVNQPFKQQSMALRFNTFVTVRFAGNKLLNVFPINREYMLLNNKVKLLDPQSKLFIKQVEVVYSNDKDLFVSSGLSVDDKVITTQLPNIKVGSELKLDNNSLDDLTDSTEG
ncbi:MAG: efflux RND transporter periplasmic adaptor subunit [Marinicellaceae bacterium]